MLRALILVPLLILGGWVAIWYFSRPTPILVQLWKIDRGRVEATIANTRVGTVKPCRRSHLAPQVGGQVSLLNVQEGDRVKAGQVLLEIWNEDLKANLNLAKSDAASASARADEACVLADVSSREASRQVRLYERNLIAQEQMERAVANAKAAGASCLAAKAVIEVREARISEVRAALERTILRAPFDGVVAEVNAELGEYITPSPAGIPTLPAVDLIDDRCLYVAVPIDEVDAPAIRKGMKAWVSLDAFPKRRFEGVVRRVEPYVLEKEKQARTVEVEIELVHSVRIEGFLTGYSADVEVILDARESVLRIPTEAVLEGYRVLVYQENEGQVVERKFKPGLSNWQFTEVISGLHAGERVVLTVGREGVKPGARVIPEATEPGARASE